jgi:multidrug efflux system membrane fusion protein
VNIHLLLETRKNATVIPTAAVQRGPQGSYVYVVKSDKTVEVRQVNVAITENNVAQIASGVSPGETVVIDGQDKLQPGSPVEPHLQPANPNGSQNAGSANAQNPSSSNPNSSSTNHNPGNRSSQNRHGPPDSGKPSTGTATQ